MTKNLVIVESPAKARTLTQILGHSYKVKASLGHVRDLPKSQLGVDIDNGFTPKYLVPKEKKAVVKELQSAAEKISAVYLATDPDREGEAISWHLVEAVNLKDLPLHRVVFHEITEEAVKDAFQHPRKIDMRLVNAQQARRILDRLVGYKLSPLLWQKVQRGLSAGRVQSAALKIVADREREIQSFIAQEYWVLEAELEKKNGKSLRAVLVSLADGTKLGIGNQEQAQAVKKDLEKAAYQVASVNTKEITRQPVAPFITSTLQQEAWRKLRFAAKHTMAVAQQLYEGLAVGNEGVVGLITYMRTDSTNVAASAMAETRDFIEQKYGADFLPARPRLFKKKVKGAQEAHEAIRPTRIHRQPELIKSFLNADQFKLYQLIWKRMVASQMAAAKMEATTVQIEARNTAPRQSYLLRASSITTVFPGFMALYSEGKDDNENEEGVKLPPLKKDEPLNLLALYSEQRFTQPPPRYTEATLVKALEEKGIGRPSTYAPTLATIQDRGYVEKTQGKFFLQKLGMVVNDLLVEHFPDIVDLGFTAQMEEALDEVARGEREWVPLLREFYTPFASTLEKASLKIERVKLPDELTSEVCPKCGKPMAVKMGRFGKFLACSGYPDCKTTSAYKVKVGVPCPECGGEIVQRRSKKKKIFYGCANYPKCNLASRYKPLPQPCPRCGGLLSQYGNQAKCFKCNFKGKVENPETQPVETRA